MGLRRPRWRRLKVVLAALVVVLLAASLVSRLLGRSRLESAIAVFEADVGSVVRHQSEHGPSFRETESH